MTEARRGSRPSAFAETVLREAAACEARIRADIAATLAAEESGRAALAQHVGDITPLVWTMHAWVEVQDVRLSGSFPETIAQIIFRDPGDAHCYGWSLSLWDASECWRAGRPVPRPDLDLWGIWFDEDRATRRPATPDPGPDGVTWLGHMEVAPAEAARRLAVPLFVPAELPLARVRCIYTPCAGANPPAIVVTCRDDAGADIAHLRQSSRWPGWLERQARWTAHAHGGRACELLDQAQVEQRGGFAVRLVHEGTHLAAAPARGVPLEDVLDLLVELRAVAPRAGSLADRPQVAFQHALELRRLEQLERAEAAFADAAASGHPRFVARSHMWVGHLARHRGDLPTAEHAYRLAASDPQQRQLAAEATLRLALLLLDHGERSRAVAELRSVVAMDDPEQAALARINLGVMAHHDGDAETAQLELRTAAACEVPRMVEEAERLLALIAPRE